MLRLRVKVCSIYLGAIGLAGLTCASCFAALAAPAPTGLMCELLAVPERTEIMDSKPEFGWIVDSDRKGDR
jgi:hypothetical protein